MTMMREVKKMEIRDIPYIDMHCDTLQMYIDLNNTEDLKSNTCHVDIDKLKKGNNMLQFFAVFMTKHELYKQAGIEIDYFQDDDVISRLLGGFCKDMYAYSKDIGWVYSYQDIIDNKKEGKLSALLSLEDGRVMKNDLDNLRRYYDMGFRSIGLTWNYENSIGYPNSSDNNVMKMGLTEFGHSLVEYMQDVGMLVDVSHLSDGGFREVLDISKKTKVPFVASHSNCRDISNSPRNLSDDMIRELSNAGGVMGINFYPVFLDNDRYKEANMNHISKVDDMVGI